MVHLKQGNKPLRGLTSQERGVNVIVIFYIQNSMIKCTFFGTAGTDEVLTIRLRFLI